MTYNVVSPYFPQEDIEEIVSRYRRILGGKGVLAVGKNVREFERRFAQYVGTKYSVSTNSCTSALELVLQAIGLKANDEVVVPTQTFIATASSVAINQGRPVFAEVNENFLLDFEDMKKKISRKTKAVIIVHFAGLIHPDILAIRDFLKKRNIYLIEDAAHAHGAKIGDRMAGNIGDFGCFSFYATKILTTGEGGMITVNDKKFYELCSSLRSRGVDVTSGKELYVNVGSSRKLTEFQAILGLYQLNRLDEFIKHRNRLAAIYKEALQPSCRKGLMRFQEFPDHIRHAYWRFLVFLKKTNINRDLLKEKLAKHGIKIDSPYEPLLHNQPVFKKMFKGKKIFLPKSQELSKTHFCLPLHQLITSDDALFISQKVRELIQ